MLGERSAGNPHAAFDVAGAGNGGISYRASSRPYLWGGGYHWAAPIPDRKRALFFDFFIDSIEDLWSALAFGHKASLAPNSS